VSLNGFRGGFKAGEGTSGFAGDLGGVGGRGRRCIGDLTVFGVGVVLSGRLSLLLFRDWLESFSVFDASVEGISAGESSFSSKSISFAFRVGKGEGARPTPMAMARAREGGDCERFLGG